MSALYYHILQLSVHSLSGLLKAIINLQKKLAPSSNFHERQDLRGLKAAVLEVQKVIERAIKDKDSVFVSDMKRIGKDWDLGRRGILEEAVQRKKVQKPKLAIDPEDRMFQGL